MYDNNCNTVVGVLQRGIETCRKGVARLMAAFLGCRLEFEREERGRRARSLRFLSPPSEW